MESLVREGSIGYILCKSNIISEENIRAALDEQRSSGSRFGESLIRLGIVTQEDIDWALSNQLDIPYVRLKKDTVDAAAVSLVPAKMARQYNLIPLIRVGDELNVAMADPLNRAAVEEVEKMAGCKVTVSVGLIREIREMQDIFYGAPAEPVSFGFSSTAFSPRLLEVINSETTGARFLDYLLAYFIQNRLVSLSLQPLGETVAVTARRSSSSRDIGYLAITHYQEFIINLRRSCRINGSGDVSSKGGLSFTFRGQQHGFQVMFLKGMGGDYVTLRPSMAATMPARFADLLLTPETNKQLARLTGGGGLLVVVHQDLEERCQLMDLLLAEVDTSGKSVMLLGEGLGHGVKRFPRIPCRDVPHGEAHSLVMAALEHDPDILSIEDATDSQTFIAASKGAMRGKLVIAGLSLKDISSTVRHLLYFWHKHYVIPTYIRGIVSCRRVAMLCPICRISHELSAEESVALGTSLPAGSYCRAVGCPECDQSGHRGSRYLLDVVPFDSDVVEVFETSTDGREVINFLSERGYRGSTEEGAELLSAGDISPEEYVTSILL